MRNTAIISPPSGGLEKCSFSEKIQFCAHLLLHVGKPMDTWFAFPTWRNTFDFSPLSIQFSVYLMESKNAIGFPMAFGTGKGCWYFTSAPFILPVFDFLTSHRVPCLWKHWFYWTISCFLIRRRGKRYPLFLFLDNEMRGQKAETFIMTKDFGFLMILRFYLIYFFWREPAFALSLKK